MEACKSTLVVVSHDRTFLDAVSTDVIHLTNKKRLEYYKGNYTNFQKVKAQKYTNDMRTYKAQQMRRNHIQEYINTFYTGQLQTESTQSEFDEAN